MHRVILSIMVNFTIGCTVHACVSALPSNELGKPVASTGAEYFLKRKFSAWLNVPGAVKKQTFE